MNKKPFANKKGNVWDAIFILVLVFAGIALSGFIGASLSGALQTQQATLTANSYAYNSTAYALQGTNTVAQQLPTVGNIGVVVVVISLIGAAIASLFVYFRTRGNA